MPLFANSATSTRGRGALRRAVALSLRATALLVLAAAALLIVYRFLPPVSTLMLGRWLSLQPVARDWVPLSAVSPHLPRAVIAAEDARFCLHGGVDWGALRAVIEEAGEHGPARGASTIAMQTAKNVFLWPGRSYLRKAAEIPLALAVDTLWSKRRVMEVYLNIAEWGDGLFGAEAAARRYFRKSARALTAREAALLAAALPNPLVRDPARPSRYVATYAARISGRLREADATCLDS
ncbi:monofunctional biosynthetic peptidoglycan transglycosylase [Chelatococcus sp. SYSU_G07232]|uniref:Biosynthetic peptidoglycan transglycosylase n=1 Tax=Chelatococcus albus TaxID=3047466 RepID=A0ABT7AF50_9HYPH|nr:monofunctional biosynthetic peptidoglycan transglycosylase [Chelatococcus sp. SYSU_G07232]MDJ1157479.1 monofunctional biosynthetic peptidoglycan transglycosylase [Chelatococcus sp. SYSU_G07232]